LLEVFAFLSASEGRNGKTSADAEKLGFCALRSHKSRRDYWLGRATSEFNRAIRGKIGGPPVKGHQPPLSTNGTDIVSAFRARYLLRDEKRQILFGRRPD